MKIQTDFFSLSANNYFKIVALNRFKRSWFIYLVGFVYGFFHLKDFGTDNLISFFVILGFAYPPLLFTYLYFWTTSKKNKIFFIGKQLTFDDEKISIIQEDNAKSEMPWTYLLKVSESKLYCLLYMTKGQFLYVPKSAFRCKEDLLEFEAKIKSLILKKPTSSFIKNTDNLENPETPTDNENPKEEG